MSRKGLLLFAAMCVIWSLPYLFIRVAVRELQPTTIIFARVILASVVLVPLAWRNGPLKAVRADFFWIAAFAAIEIGLPWWLMTDAERTVSSSFTAIIVALVPLVTVVAYRFTSAHEPVTLTRGIGLGIGIAGVVALVGLDFSHLSVRPVVELLLVTICYATGPLIMSTKLTHIHDVAVPAAAFSFVALAYAIPGLSHLPSHVSWSTIGALLVLGIICSAVAFLCFFPLVREIGPARATIVTYVNPAIAVVLGVVFLDEPITTGLLVGFPLILGGSILASRKRETVVVEPT